MSKERFVAYVYEDDYCEIQKLVQQYPNTETGGDLFGLWKDERTVIIQQFIGPGKECNRTPTSFHQDIEYLHRVGSLITTKEGLCNVGEWHSHHQIGMPEPSAADERTVFSNMPHLGLERFVLFIASIEGKGSSGNKRSRDVKLDDIKLRPFLFSGSTQDIDNKGKIKIIPGSNPHRLNSIARNEIEDGAEAPDNGKRTPTSSEKKNGRKGRDNTAQGETKKKDQSRTLQEEATAFQDSKKKGADKQSQREQPQPRRETKPLQTGGTESQGNGDDKNFGGKPDTDENRSPNLGSAPPRGRDFQGLPTSPTSQMNTPLHSGTTQAPSPGTHGNVPQTTSDPSLRQVWDASLSGAVPHFGATQGRDRDTQGQGNFSQRAYPSTSQQLFTTQPLHSQTRSHATQRNIPPTGGAYASPHPQQTSQRSARGHSQGNMSQQSYAAEHSRQAQAKGCGDPVSLGKVTGKGYF